MKKIFLAGLVLLFGSAAFAQDYPKIELSLDYSYMRFVPQNNNIIQSFSLNGGGGAGTYFFTSWIGIKAEFEGYASQTRSFNFTGTPICTGVCTGNAQGNLFTYNFGPEIKYRTEHFQPFVEALFGGARSNVYGNVVTDCVGCVFTKSPSNNAFDFIIGGGIDIPVTKMIAIRPAEVDYVLTRFGNNFTNGHNNQSNFRYEAAVVISF
jgi:Outer membrane protein beta-barrel domain